MRALISSQRSRLSAKSTACLTRFLSDVLFSLLAGGSIGLQFEAIDLPAGQVAHAHFGFAAASRRRRERYLSTCRSHAGAPADAAEDEKAVEAPPSHLQEDIDDGPDQSASRSHTTGSIPLKSPPFSVTKRHARSAVRRSAMSTAGISPARQPGDADRTHPLPE